MGLFSSAPNKKYIELICDISNGSIGVALVSKSANPEVVSNVLFTERIFSSSKQKKDSNDLINSLLVDLKTLLTKVSAQCASMEIKPSLTSCFYSSPWFISETNVLKIKQQEPIRFSEAIIKKALDEGEKNFMSGSNVNTILETENLRLIERRITRIKLNGYQTHNPIGKVASNIEIGLFLSAVSQKTISLIEETIDGFWHKINIQHHTFPLASFSMLKDEFDTQGDFLIVHTALNITEISLVSSNMLLDTFTFPIGRRNIIESVENNCKLDYELASSALSMYMKGEIHSDNTKQISNAVELTKKDWMDHFESAYNVLTKNAKIPNSVYLVTDSKIQPFFESAIVKAGLNGYAAGVKELKVFPVTRDIFSKYLTYTQPSSHKDFFLETEILYSDLITSKAEKIIGNYIVE